MRTATRSVESADVTTTANRVEAPNTADRFSSGGGDDPGDEARRDAEDYKSALAKVRGALLQLQENEDQPEQRARIRRIVEHIDAQVTRTDKTVQAGTGQPPGRAFQLVMEQRAIEDDVDEAREEARDGGESLWKKIMRWLGGAGGKLWAMISKLAKVKEWSLTGTMGTGVLGFAQASISVTFV